MSAPWEDFSDTNTATEDSPPWEQFKQPEAQIAAPSVLPEIKIDPLKNIPLFQPSQFSSGAPIGTPPESNPDWDFARATGGGLPGILAGTVNKGMDLAGKGIVAVANLPTTIANKIRGATPESANYVEPLKQGEPKIILPELSGDHSPVVRGVYGALKDTLESFTTPEMGLALPFLGLESIGKKATAAFATQLAANMPESIHQIADAKDAEQASKAAAKSIIEGLMLKATASHALSHGDVVEATLPNGGKVKGTIVGQDVNGNAVLMQDNGSKIVLPEKLQEVQNANPIQSSMETVRGETPGLAAQVAEGKSSGLQQPAGTSPSQEAGLPKEKVASTGALNKDLTPEQSARSKANNSREAFMRAQAEADASKKPLNELPKPSELISANPDQVIEWKRRVKYGPATSLEIAKGITPDDVLKLTAERDSLNQKLDGLMAKAKEAKTQADSDAILNEFQKIQLKSQTINEVLRDHAELPVNAEPTVTLYRGQDHTSPGGDYWSIDPKYAASQGKNVQTITVPKSVADAARERAKQEGNGTPGNHILPPEIAKNAEMLPPEKVPDVTQDLTPVEPASAATPEMVGMGGATPAEFQNNPQTPTGIKNATVDAERAKRGLPPAIQPARRSFGKVWDEAMAKIDQDPAYSDRLIDELRDKPRALTDLEDAVLLQRQIDLQNEYGKATRDLAQAYDDGRLDDVEELKIRTAGWSDKLLDLYNIGKKVGTETGRGLNARKMMAYEDYSLAQMETSKRAANGGRPLTEAERSEIIKLNQRITDLQKRYDDLVAAQDAKQTKPEIESVLNDTKKSVEKSPNKFIELPNIREIRSKIGNKLVENELADISGLVQKLVRAFVEENPKITRDELVDKVHGVLSEFVPDITRRDAMDAISGYGDFKPLSKDAISLVVRDLKGQLQQIGKLEDMASGNAPKKTGIERRTPSDEERRLIKQVEEEKRKGGYKVTDPETQLRTAMQAVKTRLENQIKDLESQIESRQKIVKTKTRLQYDEEANRLRATRDELKKQFDEIFPRQPISDAQRLENWKKRTQARIEELNQKLADRDFSKRTQRPPPPMDEVANKLQAELFRAKQAFQRGLIEDRLKSRPWWSKAQDTFLRWYRGGLLSSPVVFAKLTAAAIVRAGLTPIEEAVGGGIGKVFTKLSKNAPREGFWNSNAEAKAITSQLTKGPRDAWDLLIKGETNLDVLYGKGREGAIGESQVRPFSIADIPGRLHGAIKASTKRAEFERSLEKRLTYAIRNGADASNPAVQLEAAIGAYKDANRSIFLQDNLVVSAYQAALRRFEQPNKTTGQASLGGKTVTTLARTLVPIVRVPSNIVAEAFQFATGAVTGSARLAKAYAKGIETLPPEQADLIMRELKKGSIGTAALLVGYLLPNAFGGYYQRGEKRNPNDIKAGEAKIGNVDISSKLMHHPVFEAIQVGATVRRISESKAGKEAGNLAIPMGVKAAALGLIEAVPFIREMVETAKAFDPSQQNAYFGELAKSISEPQLLQWIAGKVDTTPTGEAVTRKPKTFVEHLKMGIPGLRQTVPEKNAPKSSKSVFTP